MAIACSPATPAPSTSTLAGATVPGGRHEQREEPRQPLGGDQGARGSRRPAPATTARPSTARARCAAPAPSRTPAPAARAARRASSALRAGREEAEGEGARAAAGRACSRVSGETVSTTSLLGEHVVDDLGAGLAVGLVGRERVAPRRRTRPRPRARPRPACRRRPGPARPGAPRRAARQRLRPARSPTLGHATVATADDSRSWSPGFTLSARRRSGRLLPSGAPSRPSSVRVWFRSGPAALPGPGDGSVAPAPAAVSGQPRARGATAWPDAGARSRWRAARPGSVRTLCSPPSLSSCRPSGAAGPVREQCPGVLRPTCGPLARRRVVRSVGSCGHSGRAVTAAFPPRRPAGSIRGKGAGRVGRGGCPAAARWGVRHAASSLVGHARPAAGRGTRPAGGSRPTTAVCPDRAARDVGDERDRRARLDRGARRRPRTRSCAALRGQRSRSCRRRRPRRTPMPAWRPGRRTAMPSLR